MGVRQFLNKNKPVAYTLVVVLLAGTAALVYWLNGDAMPSNLQKAFYSDDDGKNWFVDSISRVPPFDHGGKQAYMAMVYKAGSNPPFVAYLLSFTPEGQKKLQALYALPKSPGTDAQAGQIKDATSLVKKPGSSEWVPMTSATG